MKMKIIIYVNPETGEVFCYMPTPDGPIVLVEPKTEKKEDPDEEDPDEEERKVH